MTDKYKKIDKQYILSDSSVNEYGFRLMTTGYQAESFLKNPIGYYMHRREEGVALKWEDVRVEGDTIVGTPVINLANGRGTQLCEEAENGFLNAASVGHIVVLEYSTDPETMLPGQTGPTITKWYNKECSLVDIPGNCNALTKLYDAQENEINLVDLNTAPLLRQMAAKIPNEIYDVLQLADNKDEHALLNTVRDLLGKTTQLEQENKMLYNDKHALQQQLDDLGTAHIQHEIAAILDRALEDKKITVELRHQLAADYADNVTGLRQLVKAMPAYRSIAEQLKAMPVDKTEQQWTWNDYEQKDKSGDKLKTLRANDPERYQALFNEKFTPHP